MQKSVSDDRDYQFMVLPNQLRVLLISDPKADKVSMCDSSLLRVLCHCECCCRRTSVLFKALRLSRVTAVCRLVPQLQFELAISVIRKSCQA